MDKKYLEQILDWKKQEIWHTLKGGPKPAYPAPVANPTRPKTKVHSEIVRQLKQKKSKH